MLATMRKNPEVNNLKRVPSISSVELVVKSLRVDGGGADCTITVWQPAICQSGKFWRAVTANLESSGER